MYGRTCCLSCAFGSQSVCKMIYDLHILRQSRAMEVNDDDNANGVQE